MDIIFEFSHFFLDTASSRVKTPTARERTFGGKTPGRDGPKRPTHHFSTKERPHSETRALSRVSLSLSLSLSLSRSGRNVSPLESGVHRERAGNARDLFPKSIFSTPRLAVLTFRFSAKRCKFGALAERSIKGKLRFRRRKTTQFHKDPGKRSWSVSNVARGPTRASQRVSRVLAFFPKKARTLSRWLTRTRPYALSDPNHSTDVRFVNRLVYLGCVESDLDDASFQRLAQVAWLFRKAHSCPKPRDSSRPHRQDLPIPSRTYATLQIAPNRGSRPRERERESARAPLSRFPFFAFFSRFKTPRSRGSFWK